MSLTNKSYHFLNSWLTALCLIALFGGLVYRFYGLNRFGLALSLILALISFIIIQYFYLTSNKKTSRPQSAKPEKTKLKLANFMLYTLYFILVFACFYILFSQQSSGAIISPWQVVPPYFFIGYGLATILLIGNIIVNRKFALLLIMLHYFLSLAVALLVYKIGYGYDPFIHQATENLIAKTGAVEPKPFYYLSQYGLVVILHKITALPVIWLDKLLVPVLAAIFLPLTFWRMLNSWFDNQRINLLIILSLLALTFPFLLVSTPQNLAYLLLLLVIIFGLTCRNLYDFSLILLLALTAALAQPIAGIPALLYAAFLALYHNNGGKIKLYLYPFLTATTIFILPALFYFLNKKMAITGSLDAAGANLNLFKLSAAGQSNFILNFIYFYGLNFKFIIALLSLGGIIIAWKFREQCKTIFLGLIVSLALMVSYLITSRMPFAFLIDYEQGAYPARILLVACLFLLPFIIISGYWLIEKIFLSNIFIKSSFTVFLAALITASLYLSYPRYDNYFNSRGYSVSAADLAATSWINTDAKDDFIVLANQQVSAAALSQFGFKKYYGRDQLFYYPIPTSSPLYQSYLDMVYKKPSRETMNVAMALAGVNEGYFVLNKYWWAFPKILAEAKFSASSWQEFADGEVYVFKYIK